MAVEDTDLERRVLAHEQILQALMAQLAEAQPGLLDRMRDRFASARRGAHEHDYVETADYAEAFLHEVMRLVRVDGARDRPALSTPPRPPASDVAAVVIRSIRAGGVWHVTCDDVFVGDYLSETAAREAASDAANEIERQGRHADIVFATRRQGGA